MRILHNSCAASALLLGSWNAYVGVIVLAPESTATMFARLANTLKNYRSQKRTISLLSQMEDRQLWDIGLLRGDIETVVRRRRLTF